MMRLINPVFCRRALPAAAMSLLLAGHAVAASPAQTGLGQSWPNARDVSASPHWHVYVFERGGVRYIQVNDLQGNVHAAVANAGGELLALPVGSDAQSVSTPDEPAATESVPAGAGETVYRDNTVQISLTPQTDGTAVWSTQTLISTATKCQSAGECSATIQ